MRTILLGIACMMAIPCLQAQDKLDNFGKITKADLELKTCDFDPDAAAYCLIDLGEVSYNFTPGGINVETNFRKRIKILKEEGNKRADIKIRYYSKDRYEEVTNVAAFVYNLDDAGNILTTKLEKNLIYDKKIDNRYSEVSFAIPEVKVGSVIEYKYRTTKKDGIGDIEDWYFQSDIPVRYSAYNLVIPTYFDFQYQVTRRQDIDIHKGKRAEDGQWFIMHNIPHLKEEPYMSGFRDYLQRVDFQLSSITPPNSLPINYRTSWGKLGDELLEKEWFGLQLKKNISGTGAPLKALLANARTQKQKIDAIYKFVQTNMSWNGRYSYGSIDGVKDAWDKKSGNLGDINLILLNLLKDNHIKAYPILISTRDNGKINPLLPFLEQFNGVYVYAEPGDGFLPMVMNAADKYNPSDIYPYDVQLTSALVVGKDITQIVSIEDPAKKLKHIVNIFMQVDDKGQIDGNATVNSYEYGKNIRRKTYDDNNLGKFFENNEGIKIKVDSMEVENQQVDSLPLMQKVYFSGNIQQSGEYGFIPYNLFSGLAKNPFVAEERSSDIDFGFNQSFMIIGNYSIPVDFEYEELPKNIRMILPDSSIMMTRMIQKNDNILNFKVNIDFQRSVYTAEEYPDVKEVYKRIFAYLNEHVVIRKKKK